MADLKPNLTSNPYSMMSGNYPSQKIDMFSAGLSGSVFNSSSVPMGNPLYSSAVSGLTGMLSMYTGCGIEGVSNMIMPGISGNIWELSGKICADMKSSNMFGNFNLTTPSAGPSKPADPAKPEDKEAKAKADKEKAFDELKTVAKRYGIEITKEETLDSLTIKVEKYEKAHKIINKTVSNEKATKDETAKTKHLKGYTDKQVKNAEEAINKDYAKGWLDKHLSNNGKYTDSSEKRSKAVNGWVNHENKSELVHSLVENYAPYDVIRNALGFKIAALGDNRPFDTDDKTEISRLKELGVTDEDLATLKSHEVATPSAVQPKAVRGTTAEDMKKYQYNFDKDLKEETLTEERGLLTQCIKCYVFKAKGEKTQDIEARYGLQPGCLGNKSSNYDSEEKDYSKFILNGDVKIDFNYFNHIQKKGLF